jgi:hypothetical protein
MNFRFEQEFKIKSSIHNYSIAKLVKEDITCYITNGFKRNKQNKYEIEICDATLSQEEILILIDDLYWETGNGYNFEDGDIGFISPGKIPYCMRQVIPTDFSRDDMVQAYYNDDHEDRYRLRVIITDDEDTEARYRIKEIYRDGEIHHYVTEGMTKFIPFEIELMPLHSKEESLRILNRICRNVVYGILVTNDNSNPEYREKIKIKDMSRDSSNVINSLNITYVEVDALDGSNSRRYRAVLTDARGRFPWDMLCAEPFKKQLSEDDLNRVEKA